MRNVSLRAKVGFNLVGFTLFFVLTLIMAIGFGFEPIYYSIQKHNMVTAARSISEIYGVRGPTGFDEINEITHSVGTDIFIVDQGVLVYSSGPDKIFESGSSEGDKKDRQRIKANMPQHIRIIASLLNGYKPQDADLGKVMYYTDENGEHIRFFSLITRMGENAYVIISQPLAPLRENVRIVQRFILFFGILWVVVAILGALRFSRRLTEPLDELKSIATDMAHLNFSRKWNDVSPVHDEIDMVGKSLNILSSRLATALDELQQSNAALQQQLDKANEIEYMRKSFISAVSHELKTPLAIIQGYAEALEDLCDVPQETQEYYCYVIRSETRKMDGLVKDLLNLSRLEAGRLHLELTDFDFGALMDEAQYRFKGPAEEKHLRLTWLFPEEMPVYGDPGRYNIIMNNFLSNAIDYAKEGGEIRVTVVEEETDYMVEVFNQGEQIPEEYHRRIWEPFYKVDSSHSRDGKRMFGGHGLGLGIVASLLALHEQRYGLRNEKDGVTFWFTVAKPR